MLLLDRNLRRLFKLSPVWWCRGKRKALPGSRTKQWVSLLEKKKKKTLSFSNLLPKLSHPKTNKGHVTAAKCSRLPFTCGPGHQLSNKPGSSKKICQMQTSERHQIPSPPLLFPEVTQAGATRCLAQSNLKQLFSCSVSKLSSSGRSCSPGGDPWPGKTRTSAGTLPALG